MRKILLGFLIGVGLTLSFNVSAAVKSMIGKTIENEFTVKLDGIALDTKALGVEGSSYAPIRLIADALGLNVRFDNNEVLITRPKGGAQILTESAPKVETPQSLIVGNPTNYDEILKEIKRIEEFKLTLENQIKKNIEVGTFLEKNDRFSKVVTAAENDIAYLKGKLEGASQTPSNDEQERTAKLRDIENEVNSLKSETGIPQFEKMIESLKSKDLPYDNVQKGLDELKARLVELEKQKSALQP